jgi:WD40 repeat protein
MTEQETQAPPAASTEQVSVFVAYRRGADEGDAGAGWVLRALSEGQHRSESGIVTFKPFVDRYAPPLSDWRDTWRGELQTARGFVLVCSAGTSTKHDGQDWLYEEIDWWLEHRRTAPILIDASASAPANIPHAIHERWPHAQWLTWRPSLDAAEERRLRASLIDGVLLSERGVSFQEIRRLTLRNRALTVLLLVALALGGSFLAARNAAERSRRTAVARYLANEGYQSFRDGRFNRAAWLAAEAVDRGGAGDADGALRDSLSRLPRRVLRFDAAGVLTAVPSPRGDVFLVVRDDGVISVRRVADGNEVLQFAAEHATTAAWHPDGERIFVVGGQREVRIGRRGTLVPLPKPREPRSSGFCDIWSIAGGTARRLGGVELSGPPAAVGVLDSGARLSLIHSAYAKEVYRVTPDFSLVSETSENFTFNGYITSGMDIVSGNRQIHLTQGFMRTASDDLREIALTEDAFKDADGNVLLDKGSSVAVVDTASKQVRERVRFENTLGIVTFSPDRRYLASLGRDMLELWDRYAGRMILRRKFSGDPPGLRFSPNSQYLAVNLPQGRLAVWRLGDRPVLDAPDAEVEAGGSLEIGNDGTLLIPQGAYDDIFQLAGADAFSPFRAAGGSAVISDDGNYLAYEPAGEQYSLSIADLQTGVTLATVKGYYAMEFSPDKKWLLARATVNEDPHTFVLSVRSGGIVRDLGAGVQGASFSDDGQSVMARLYGSPLEKLSTIDVKTGNATTVDLPGDAEAVRMFESGPRAVIAEGKELQMWDVRTHTKLWTVPVDVGYGYKHAAFSPDGTLILIWNQTTCWVVDATLRRLRWQKDIERPEPIFSPNSRLIRLILPDSVLILDAGSGKERTRIRNAGTVVAEFNIDSRVIATASEELAATVWSVNDGATVARMRTDLPVREVLFDPADRYLMVFSSDTQSNMFHVHYIRLARWKTAAVRGQLCDRLNQALSKDEWDSLATNEPYRNLCPAVPVGRGR